MLMLSSTLLLSERLPTSFIDKYSYLEKKIITTSQWGKGECRLSRLCVSHVVMCMGWPQAVPWLRSLVAALSPRRPGFAPGSIHVGFVVDKVAVGQVFLRVLRFSPVSIIPPSLSKLISSGECVIC
jgi:hypothetical protein